MTKTSKRFGYFLVELRNASGCTSRAAAVEKINSLSKTGEELVSERQLFRWENGEMLPKIKAALAVGSMSRSRKRALRKAFRVHPVFKHKKRPPLALERQKRT